MEITEVLTERGKNYGSYELQSARGQEIQKAMHLDDDRLTSFERDALQMIAMKLSRITFGNPHYIENWRDICGYSQLVIDILNNMNGAVDARVIRREVINGELVDITK